MFWRNLPRANFKVNASHEPGASRFTIGLKHAKNNNGPRLKGIGLELTFGDNSLRFSKVDPKTAPDLAQHLPLKDQISGLLAHGSLDSVRLADELDKPENTVRATLSRYKDSFVKVGA